MTVKTTPKTYHIADALSKIKAATLRKKAIRLAILLNLLPDGHELNQSKQP